MSHPHYSSLLSSILAISCAERESLSLAVADKIGYQATVEIICNDTNISLIILSLNL